MNVSIIGTGGVVGYFGWKLTQLLETDKNLYISFIARGRHLEAIRKNGLLLETAEGQIVCRPSFATDRIEDLPKQDLCLISVKAYDPDNVLNRLKPKIKDSTILLPLLNGVDIYERIRTIVKNGIVFPFCGNNRRYIYKSRNIPV